MPKVLYNEISKIQILPQVSKFKKNGKHDKF